MHPLLPRRTQDTVAVERRRCCRARRGVGALAPSLSYGLASWLLGQQRKLQGGRSAKSNQRIALEFCCSTSSWGRRVKHRRARPCLRRAAVSTWHATAVCAQREAHAAGQQELQGLGMPTATTPRARTLPNPSVKPSPNGGPPGPVRGAQHFPQPGPGVPPLSPA